jgi:ABC-type Fe3+/spermidine/putrescine transport system ATPase subunit
MTSSEFAVEMQDVLKQFVTPEGGILSAVDHVTMQIKDGEFFSLLGPIRLRQDDLPAHDRRI